MKLNKEILEELENQFPKGECKERGQAPVLHSIAQMEINNIFRDIEEAIKKCISDKPVQLQESKFIKELKKIKEKYLDEI